MHRFLLLLAMQVIVISVFAQSVILKGKVVSTVSGETIELANVYVDSIFIASTTNSNGAYELNKLSEGSFHLCVSHIGYQKFHKTVDLHSGVNNLDIELTPVSEIISPIVVTGTGTHYRLDNVPVQTEIITKKDIAEISGNNVEEVLSNISSSVDFSTSSMGTNIKINGLGNDYVLVLVDGKRLNGGVSGYTDLGRINTDDIEQIEIVKGASSTLYGSDAIAGVINIITKRNKQKISISNSTRIQEYNRGKQLTSVEYNRGKLSSKTTFNYKQTGGWQLTDIQYNTKWEDNHSLPYLVHTYYMPVNKNRSYTVTQFFEYDINEKLTFNANASWYGKRLFFPFKAQMHDYYYNNRSAAFGGNYKLKNNNYIDFSVDYNNYLYYTEYPYKYNQSYRTEDGILRVTYYPGDSFKNTEQTTIIAQAKGVFNLNTKNKLSIGTEYFREDLEAKYRLLNDDAFSNTYSLYGQDEISLGTSVNIVAGIRAIYHDKSEFTVTPKVSGMYKIGSVTLRSSYANGFKSPTLKELYYYYESDRMGMHRLYIGNENLKPQKSHYISFSTEYSKRKFNTSINLYVNRIYDMVEYKIISADEYTKITGDTLSYNQQTEIEEIKMRYNIDKAQSIGVDWHFGISLFKQLKINGGYSYVDAQNLTQNIRLNGISEHSATVKISWTKKWDYYRLDINLSGVYKSEKFYLEEDLERSYTEPYQLWKLTTNHSLVSNKNFKLIITGGLDNIFNYVDTRPYGSHYSTLNPGRTVFVGINIKYSTNNKN